MTLGKPNRYDLVTESTHFSEVTVFGPFDVSSFSTFSIVYQTPQFGSTPTIAITTGVDRGDGTIVGSTESLSLAMGFQNLYKPQAADTHFEALQITIAANADLDYLSVLVY